MTNFIIESIVIEGFRSFREPQTFLVDRPPGLYFIGGKNFVEAIGANGSGKSSIWDALVWCFFGKSLLGVKGGNVKNWDAKVCKVSVPLLKDDTEYIITRTQGPNSLTLNGETVVQHDLDEFLHLDWEKFIFSLIVGQFNATFLDLQPTEKLNLFSSVMGLGFWESCSKEASTRYTELHKRAQSVAVEVGAIQARVTALEASRASLEAFSSTFEGSRASQIMDLDRAATETMALIEQVDIDRRLMQAKRHTQDTAIHGLEFDVERLTANITDIEGQWKSFADTIIADRATIATLTQDFNKWRDLKSSTCPYCEQGIEASVIATHKRELSKQILALQKVTKKNEETCAKLQDQIKINFGLRKEAEAKLKLARTAGEALLVDAGALETEKEKLTDQLRHTRERIDQVREGDNPYSKPIQTCRSELAAAQAQREQVDGEYTSINKALTGNEFWVKGFKELRMWVIADNLAALEVEANTALSKLGLTDWKLKFQMERENSSGGLSKGFHVLVQAKGMPADTYVPWEVWSGGEKQRLRLSGVKGWSSLIQNWKGLQFNFSVWDEPSSYLSQEGIDDLLQFLDEEAKEAGKAIYLIDQRHIESPYFTSSIRIEKHAEGSRIIEIQN